MPCLKAVIFDFDGVLADSVPLYREAVAEAVGQAGVSDPDTADIASCDTRTVARRLIERHNLDLDAETLTKQIERFALDKLLAGPRVVPGAGESQKSRPRHGNRVVGAAPQHRLGSKASENPPPYRCHRGRRGH